MQVFILVPLPPIAVLWLLLSTSIVTVKRRTYVLLCSTSLGKDAEASGWPAYCLFHQTALRDGLKARLHDASFGATCSLRLEARRSMHPRMHQSCACGEVHVVASAPQLQWESSCNLINRHIGLVTQLDVFRILYLNSAIIQINR